MQKYDCVIIFFNRADVEKHLHLTGGYIAKNKDLPLLAGDPQYLLCDTNS